MHGDLLGLGDAHRSSFGFPHIFGHTGGCRGGRGGRRLGLRAYLHAESIVAVVHAGAVDHHFLPEGGVVVDIAVVDGEEDAAGGVLHGYFLEDVAGTGVGGHAATDYVVLAVGLGADLGVVEVHILVEERLELLDGGVGLGYRLARGVLEVVVTACEARGCGDQRRYV